MSYVPTRADLYEKITELVELADEVYSLVYDAKNNTDFSDDDLLELARCSHLAAETSIMMSVFIKRLNLKEEQDEN